MNTLRNLVGEWKKEAGIWFVPGGRDEDTGEEDDGNVYANTMVLCARELSATLPAWERLLHAAAVALNHYDYTGAIPQEEMDALDAAIKEVKGE